MTWCSNLRASRPQHLNIKLGHGQKVQLPMFISYCPAGIAIPPVNEDIELQRKMEECGRLMWIIGLPTV